MIAAIEGPVEWATVIILVPLILSTVWMTWVLNRPRSDSATNELTLHRAVMRHSMEAQLLALGVPPEHSSDEARQLLARHMQTPVTETGMAELHDDVVRTAGAWA